MFSGVINPFLNLFYNFEVIEWMSESIFICKYQDNTNAKYGSRAVN